MSALKIDAYVQQTRNVETDQEVTNVLQNVNEDTKELAQVVKVNKLLFNIIMLKQVVLSPYRLDFKTPIKAQYSCGKIH